ncbi:MAG: F0F1 ATP synthase subunit B [Henriciella sp.]
MNVLMFAADAAHADGGAAAFPPFDPWHFPSQIFWLVVLFGFLYIVLSRFILPKLGGVLEHRESTIADDLDEAARMNDQAVEAQNAVEVSIAQAQAKARETANKAKLKIDSEIAEASAKVDADLETKLSEAETRITKLRAEALENVETIATDAATGILAKFDAKSSASDVKSAVKTALSGT